MANNVRFETIKSEMVQLNERNFIEIADKRAVSNDGERQFISISRGYIAQTGEKRFKNSVAIPPEALDKVIASLDRIRS